MFARAAAGGRRVWSSRARRTPRSADPDDAGRDARARRARAADRDRAGARRRARRRVARVAAHRRRRIDLPARRRHEARRRVVIPFERACSVRRMLETSADPFCSLVVRAFAAAAVAAAAAQPPRRQPPVDRNDRQRSPRRHRTARSTGTSSATSRWTPAATRRSTPTTSMVFTDEDRAIATGNVVLAQGNNRISADRADFNTETRLGTFYNASGIATVQPPTQAPRPGGVRAAADRRPGHRRLFLRREDREDRRRRNTRSPTAASRPACSRRRAGICTPTRSS